MYAFPDAVPWFKVELRQPQSLQLQMHLLHRLALLVNTLLLTILLIASFATA